MQTQHRRPWRGPFHPVNRVQPITALRAVRALIRNPESTGEVFKVIQALRGGSLRQSVDRMSAHEAGRELLRSKPSILERLSDREALAAMPEGSLGRVYLDFVLAGNLSAEGLVAAVVGLRGHEREQAELASRSVSYGTYRRNRYIAPYSGIIVVFRA